MNDNPMVEEVLEILWTAVEEEGMGLVPLERLGLAPDHPLLTEMVALGLLRHEDTSVRPTVEGRREAREAVRRHRLAERLVSDVLNIDESRMEDAACAFEHLVRRDVEESVCTLLGHPRSCPHGKPIPPGKCCEEERTQVRSAVLPLSGMKDGEEGMVAYLHEGDGRDTLSKLMALGVLPGCRVQLLQKFPSFLFRIGLSQMAVDITIAEAIYVRRSA
ncbi:MAG: metal-dependent transcriptional regulator [Desulfobacteria bacterium]